MEIKWRGAVVEGCGWELLYVDRQFPLVEGTAGRGKVSTRSNNGHLARRRRIEQKQEDERNVLENGDVKV